MQLAKSEAVKKNLIQTWTGRLHLPQIDFCKSRVSNIRSQNALIDIRDPRSSAAVQKCFHNPPESIHSPPSCQIGPHLVRICLSV